MRITATEHGRGRYSAGFTVPRGGIRKLAVGLVGWRITATTRKRADAIFQFAAPLTRRCG